MGADDLAANTIDSVLRDLMADDEYDLSQALMPDDDVILAAAAARAAQENLAPTGQPAPAGIVSVADLEASLAAAKVGAAHARPGRSRSHRIACCPGCCFSRHAILAVTTRW